MPSIYILVKINNSPIKIKALIDEGAKALIISRATAARLGLLIRLDAGIYMQGAAGRISFISYYKRVKVDAFGVQYLFTFFILGNNKIPTLLG